MSVMKETFTMKVSKILPEKTENEKFGSSAVKWFQEFMTLGGITQVICMKKMAP